MPNENRYQTPPTVARFMVGLIPDGVDSVLEPTPGNGNLVAILKEKGYAVTAPEKFEDLDPWLKFDAVVMNPPFKRSIEHQFLFDAMRRSNVIIALMPWFTLINGDSRTEKLFDFGIVSVTHLPRKTFPKIRVQTCVIMMMRGYIGKTELNWYRDFKKQNL